MANDSVKLRAAGARIVHDTLAGASLDACLARHGTAVSLRDHAMLRAMATGVIRNYRLYDAICSAMLHDAKRTPALALALIQIGLHQIRGMRVPPHAAVGETVDAARLLKLPGFAKLINGILRRYLRDRETIEAALPTSPGVTQSVPDWLVKALQTDWPDQWPALLEAGNALPPMTLRINRQRVSFKAFIAALGADGITARPVPGVPDAVVLDTPVGVTLLPGFEDGWFSVQDASAQIAAGLFDLKSGQRLLDACAAPGGKTAHLLEHEPSLDVLALDSDAERLHRVSSGLDRLGLRGRVQHADASQTADWWDGTGFDHILLDAPCTGTGVIRRHPDIKCLRRSKDVPALVKRQRALLDALWPTLKPGGTLVYATCSLLRAEGSGVVGAFLAATRDARADRLELRTGTAEAVGHRIPVGGSFDGFYYARLVKAAAG